MKIIAWTVVVMGWLAYGLTILAAFIHPKQSDPIEDVKRVFSGDHWEFTLVMVLLIICWYSCWMYLRGEK